MVWRRFTWNFECQSEEFIPDLIGKQEGTEGFCFCLFFFFPYGSDITVTFASEKIILAVM